MNKSRISLLIGALVTALLLAGCSVAGKMLNTASSVLGGVAGDRSNIVTKTVGRVGDFYGALGADMTTPESGAPTVVPEVPSELTASSTPVPTPMVATPSERAPAATVKVPRKATSPSIKAVAVVSAASAAKKK